MRTGRVARRCPVARALLRADRDLLVFDEANSRLDVAADAELTRRLRSLTGTTRMIITHRLESARDADRIYLIADGAVAECGNHAELLLQQGQYARLLTGLTRAQP